MAIETTTHLNFRGNARAALSFYQHVFGGELVVATYADVGNPDPAIADLITWGQVKSAEGFHVMAYDVQPERPFDPGENAVFVSVRGTSPEEIRGYWDKLADGAITLFDLAPAAWSPLYGMLKDRFGVNWVLDVAVPYPAG